MGLPRTDGPRRGLNIAPGQYKLIKALAAAGARESIVARRLGFSAASWSRLKAADAKALAAFQAGRDALELELIAAVRNPALPDDDDLSVSERIALMRAQQHGSMVIGNSYYGWNKPDVDASAPVSVTITLPGAMSPGDYAKTVAGIAISAGKPDDE